MIQCCHSPLEMQSHPYSRYPLNANTLVLLKIILEIVLIMRILALNCKWLLFLFVKLWVTIKESSGPHFR